MPPRPMTRTILKWASDPKWFASSDRLRKSSETSRRVRVDRGKVDHELAVAGDRGETIPAEHHLFDGGSIRQAHEDGIGGLGDIARPAGEPGTSVHQRRGFAGGAVPDRDVVAGVDEAPRHRKSHHSEPEIAEFFHSPLV